MALKSLGSAAGSTSAQNLPQYPACWRITTLPVKVSDRVGRSAFAIGEVDVLDHEQKEVFEHRVVGFTERAYNQITKAANGDLKTIGSDVFTYLNNDITVVD